MKEQSSSKEIGRVRWIIFSALWLLVLLNFIDRAALTVALPFISNEFKLTPVIEGLLLGSFFWTYLLFQIPGGYLLDRFGPRRVVGAAGIIWSLFQIAGGFATSGIFLVISRLGLGAAEAPMFPAGAKLNANWLPPAERARGATFIDAAGPFGAAVGGLIVSAIIAVFGDWRWAFIITGIVTIAVAIAYYCYLRDTPDTHPAIGKAEREYILQSDNEQVAKATPNERNPKAKDYLRSRSFWGMMLGRFGWATVWWGIIAWTPSYLANELDFDLAGLGWGTFLIYGMGVVGQLVAGYVTDLARRRSTNHNRVMKTVFSISGLGSAAAIVVLANTTSGPLAVALLAATVFFINFGGLYWAIPAWLAPKQQVGTVGGVMNIASSGGGGLAPVIMGIAIGMSGGYVGAFLFLGAAALLYVLGSSLIDFEHPMAHAHTRRKSSASMGVSP